MPPDLVATNTHTPNCIATVVLPATVALSLPHCLTASLPDEVDRTIGGIEVMPSRLTRDPSAVACRLTHSTGDSPMVRLAVAHKSSKETPVLLSFRYDCPEPVLVK